MVVNTYPIQVVSVNMGKNNIPSVQALSIGNTKMALEMYITNIKRFTRTPYVVLNIPGIGRGGGTSKSSFSECYLLQTVKINWFQHIVLLVKLLCFSLVFLFV